MWTAAESLPAPEGGSKESPARVHAHIYKGYTHKSKIRPINGLMAALTGVSGELHYLMLKSRCMASQEVI